MTRARISFMLGLVVLTTFGPVSSRAYSGTRLLFGAYVPPSPESGMTAFRNLEKAIGRQLDAVSFFQAWGDGSHSVFHEAWVSAAAAGGRRVLLTWEPWSSGGSADQPTYRLRRIVDGRFDRYITSWAKGLKAYGGRVFLRPMHEMNGNWYPWSGVTNGNTPRLYRLAWRHVHDIFARVGAKNVRWVWSPYVQDVPSTNRFESYYPGDAYVDVLGLDGYNWGACVPAYGGWRSFDNLFRNAYDRIARVASKPVWVAETASAPDGGDKPRWVKNMFGSIVDHYPRVRVVIWFHTNKECDWRLTSPARTATVAGLTLQALV